MRRASDRLDPSHLHRRLGERGLRRREPALLSGAGARAARLAELLGLTDEELVVVLDSDPLSVVSGELDHRAELPILLDLLAEPAESVGPAVLRRWVRATGPTGRPIDLLLARDFAGFERAIGDLGERGFVLRGGGS